MGRYVRWMVREKVRVRNDMIEWRFGEWRRADELLEVAQGLSPRI